MNIHQLVLELGGTIVCCFIMDEDTQKAGGSLCTLETDARMYKRSIHSSNLRRAHIFGVGGSIDRFLGMGMSLPKEHSPRLWISRVGFFFLSHTYTGGKEFTFYDNGLDGT